MCSQIPFFLFSFHLRLTPPENIIVGSVLGVFTTADDDHIPGEVYYTIHHGNEKGNFLKHV